MKVTKAIFGAVIAAAVAGTAAAEVSVTADFASAYVFRGNTFNDEVVFQPGIEASGLGLPEQFGGLTVGAWANYDIGDYGDTLTSSQFSEVDWYASYSLPTFVDGLDLFVGYCEYTYPLSGDDTEAPTPADKEVNVGAGYEVAGIGLGVTYYQFVGGDFTGDAFIEFALGYGFDLTEQLGLGLAADARYLENDNGGESGFNDYTVGADLSYAINDVWGVGVSLTYIGQGDDKVLADVEDGGSYDVDLVGMLSVSAAF